MVAPEPGFELVKNLRPISTVPSHVHVSPPFAAQRFHWTPLPSAHAQRLSLTEFSFVRRGKVSDTSDVIFCPSAVSFYAYNPRCHFLAQCHFWPRGGKIHFFNSENNNSTWVSNNSSSVDFPLVKAGCSWEDAIISRSDTTDLWYTCGMFLYETMRVLQIPSRRLRLVCVSHNEKHYSNNSNNNNNIIDKEV